MQFVGKSIPDVKSTVKRQLGPRAWLISFAAPIETEYVHSKDGFVVLQPWHIGRKHDPLRNAIAVGNPRILKGAIAAASPCPPVVARGPPTVMHTVPQARTAQGPVQELLEAKIKASEDRMKALLEEQRTAAESRLTDMRSRLDQHQACQEVKARQIEETLQQHRAETQQAVQELKETSCQNHSRLERSMSEQVSAMLAELGKLTRGETKRSPAPSPDGGNPEKLQKKNWPLGPGMTPIPQGPCVSLLTGIRVAATRHCQKKNFNLGLRNWIALAFASIALLGGHMEVCDYRDDIGMSLPVATLETVMRPLSERVRPKAGKQSVRFASVNDTHPDSRRAYPVVTLFQAPTFSNPIVRKSWRDLPIRFPVWTDEPPVSSPFSFPAIVLCGILFGFHYVGAGWPHSFMGTSWLLCTLAALPICAHWSERCTVTRYLYCHPPGPFSVHSTTRVRTCTIQLRTLCRGYLVFCLLAISLAWLFVPWDPGVSSHVSLTKTVQYWRPAAVMGSMRIGEASNPGPDFVVSTLNVASLSMHQDEVQVASHSPTIRVFTETCLPIRSSPQSKRNPRQVQKFVVPRTRRLGCLLALRRLLSPSLVTLLLGLLAFMATQRGIRATLNAPINYWHVCWTMWRSLPSLASLWAI